MRISEQLKADPIPTNVNWPELVALAERRGVPVLRIDEHGAGHIIRTRAQLAAAWAE